MEGGDALRKGVIKKLVVTPDARTVQMVVAGTLRYALRPSSPSPPPTTTLRPNPSRSTPAAPPETHKNARNKHTTARSRRPSRAAT